jgi:hypothetical protein
MLLKIRNILPLLSGVVFLGTFWFLDKAGHLGFLDWASPKERDYVFIGVLVSYFLFAIIVDRAYVKIIKRKYGVNPHKLSWRERRRRDGFLFCPNCLGATLEIPKDKNPKSMVVCQDCRSNIGPYDEIGEFFEEVRPDLFKSLNPLNRLR